ncbi:hypothetical protein Tco_0246384 [Tanacetum coccineum]
MYLKKAQYEKLCLYEIPYDQSDPANRLVLDREETLTLEKESRSKLNKDLVRPYDYTKLNNLYEIFKPASQEYNEQLAHANEVRKKIELVDQAWEKHSHNHFRAPTAFDMEVLIKTCLMPLAIKTQNDSFTFVHELKQEMHADLKYVESLEKEIEELESDKAEFSNMYDILLQECVSNDIVQPIVFIVDSGCTKHMTGNLKLLFNFVEKYLGIVHFDNDQFALILGYGDLVQGNITINWVYYVEGLNHNLFSVGQFCDANLEVAFRKSTCFVRDLQGNDLLTDNRGYDLYTISLLRNDFINPNLSHC